MDNIVIENINATILEKNKLEIYVRTFSHGIELVTYISIRNILFLFSIFFFFDKKKNKEHCERRWCKGWLEELWRHIDSKLCTSKSQKENDLCRWEKYLPGTRYYNCHAITLAFEQINSNNGDTTEICIKLWRLLIVEWALNSLISNNSNQHFKIKWNDRSWSITISINIYFIV